MKKLIPYFLAFVVLAGGYGYYEWNRPHQDLATAKEDVSIGANALLTAFESDENAANQLYLDKVIKVNGVIKSVEKSESGEITVILATDNDMSSVICNLNPDDTHPPNMKAGQNVSLKGLCSGYLMDVVLERCALAQK